MIMLHFSWTADTSHPEFAMLCGVFSDDSRQCGLELP